MTARVSPVRRLLALKAFPGFAHLPPAQLIELGAHGRARSWERGVVLQRAGLTPECLHLVVSGYVIDARDGLAVAHIEPYELVGGMEVLTGEPVSFSAVAGAPATTLSLDVGVLEAILGDNFAVYTAVLADMARRVRDMRQKIAIERPDPAEATLSAEGVMARLAALLELSELASLPLDVLARVALGARQRRLGTGAVVWKKGQHETYAVLPLSGRMRCSGAGSEFWATPGQLWGLEEALAGEPRWYHARAEEELEALIIDRRVLLDELEDDGDAALAFLHALARRASRLAAYLRLYEQAR